jgi:hypothetical protein
LEYLSKAVLSPPNNLEKNDIMILFISLWERLRVRVKLLISLDIVTRKPIN